MLNERGWGCVFAANIESAGGPHPAGDSESSEGRPKICRIALRALRYFRRGGVSAPVGAEGSGSGLRHPVSEIDLLYLHELTKESIDNLNVRFSKDFNVDVRLSEWLDMFTNTEKNKRNLYQGVKKVVDAIRSISIVDNSKLLIKWTNLLSSINRNESIQHDLLEDRKSVV